MQRSWSIQTFMTMVIVPLVSSPAVADDVVTFVLEPIYPEIAGKTSHRPQTSEPVLVAEGPVYVGQKTD